MSASSIGKIKKECERFCRIKGVPEEQQKTLITLAIRSYYGMPKQERKNWSLKAIVDQGL